MTFTSCLFKSQEITAKPGEDVTLQCQGPRDEAVLMLRWTRADLTAEDGYVFFTREKHLSHEKYQHESYRGRVKLKDPEMKDGDVSVILKNVTINDTGTYECYVGYEGSYPKVFNSINLTVEPGVCDRNSRGHVGLAVGLSVTVLVGFMFFRKLKRTGQSTNSAPADSSDVS
uniref:Ig-like domain-containing protein n=1 Tax=Anabas testudineus TaxID=64144 RepID=A0AAQ6IM14_ANATE